MVRLVKLLRDLKKSGKLTQQEYFRLYVSENELPKFYGLPKIHKEDNHLRPIVSSIGCFTHEPARFLARILGPTAKQASAFSVKNSKEFVRRIRVVVVRDGYVMVSFDVTALFTSIPIKKALEYVRIELEADEGLSSRTKLSVDEIMDMLELCLSNTVFEFRGQVYQHISGVPMGSPVSPLVAEIFMAHFEKEIIETSPVPVPEYFRYHLCA